MKQNRILLFLTAFLAIAMVFYACEKNDLKPERGNSPNGQVLAEFVGDENGENEPAYDCEEVCIDLSADPVEYFEISGQASYISNPQNNNNPNGKYLYYTVYNTENSFVVELTYTRDNGSNDPTVKASVIYGDETKTKEKTLGYGIKEQFVFDLDIVACEEVTWEFEETTFDLSASLKSNGTYFLVGVCQTEDCEEEFKYTENEDGSFTFTYISPVDIPEAELVFTFAQMVDVEGLDSETWEANGATMQATIDIEACQVYEWTVTFSNPRCTGQGQSEINAWTDFKVNDDSKKGDLKNIVIPCE